ncbi:MAG: hypothetical protein ACXWXV_04485, partial [Aeromicrobium sp.]
WPLVRAKNPAAGTLLDQMDVDHKRIAPAITTLEEAAQAYRFVLLHGFARSYRRNAALRWDNGAAAKLPSLQLSMVQDPP